MVNGFKRKNSSYKDIKSDPTIKHKWIGWLLEKKLFYVAVLAAGVIAVTPVIQAGASSFQNLKEEYEEPSPYMSIDPEVSHGVAWAKELIKNSHGLENWEVMDNIQPSHSFLKEKLGSNIGLPPETLLATTIGSNGPIKAFIQVYGAGQARKQFNAYTTALSETTATQISNTEEGVVFVKFENSFLIVAGDSIVGFSGESKEVRDNLFNEWINSVKSTLPESSCLSINATIDESSRSLFYGEANYKGLHETQKVETEVNVSNLPTVTGTQLLEINNTEIKEPEAPLPSNIEKLPKEVKRPTLAGAPRSEGGFIVDASYVIADPDGPGCGWLWSAQRSLVYDLDKIEENKNEILATTLSEVNEKAKTYVASSIDWARLAALFLPQADNWNKYTNKVNSIHQKWANLEAGRANFRPQWDSYIANHEAWSTFDSRKAKAQADYDKLYNKCVADNKALDDWVKKYEKELEEQEKTDSLRAEELRRFNSTWDKKMEGVEGEELEELEELRAKELKVIQDRIKEEDKDRVVIPEKPKACSPLPEKPAILNETKPTEPAAPTPPENVTIPNSWPRPTA